MEAEDLGSFFVIYKNFATAENKSKRTIEAVTNAVTQFNLFLGNCSDINQVQAIDLRNYILSLQGKHKWANHPTISCSATLLSPDSVASYVRSIKSFWSWLKREDFIANNPFEKVRVPKIPKRAIIPLSQEQLVKVLKIIPRKTTLGERDYAIILTLYGTGMRIGELLNLGVNDVNFETGQIKVMGKGSKERVVFMSARLYKVLIKYFKQWRPQVTSKHFFTNHLGRPLNRFDIAHRMQSYGKQAGIVGVRCSPHTLRYSFSIEFLRCPGSDTFSLQRILGHSTQEMTQHYAQFANSDIEAKQKAFSPVEKLPFNV